MKNKRKPLSAAVILCIALVGAALIAGTAAFMFRRTQTYTNRLQQPEVKCEVKETFNAALGQKTSIRVQNTGNVPAYLRVRLAACWETAGGSPVGVSCPVPEVDYDTANWLYDASNDTYYCKTPVAAGAYTPELLKSPVTLDSETTAAVGWINEPVSQALTVLAEAVQAEPAAAVEDLWPFAKVVNGNLTQNTSSGT